VTIRKGDSWGEIVDPPAGLQTFRSSRELARLLTSSPSSVHGKQFSCILLAKNFQRLLGRSKSRGKHDLRIVVDLLQVEVTAGGVGRQFIAIDTVLLPGSRWSGAVVLITNTGFAQGRRLAPRAHPNDGRMDVLKVDPTMTVRQRLLAVQRTRWGTHLPHPCLSVDQMSDFSWSGPAGSLHIDGQSIRSVTDVTVRVLPDALVLYA
jgi:hypothetical protein